MMQSSSDKPGIIVICGPTGIGKTSAGIKVGQIFKGQIISADSMQIYRYMDIGTAKPTPEELRRIRHHLIDIVDPDEHFDAARFSELARSTANHLYSGQIVPIVVGGTGMYIKAMLYGMFKSDPPSSELRASLAAEAHSKGSAVLHRRLAALDPAAAEQLHPNDTYRIIRALETIETSGKSITAFHGEHRFREMPYRAFKIGLITERATLYERIDTRVDGMIAEGLLAEVQGLLARGYDESLKSMQSIGYRHMVDYLKGRLTWEEAVRTLKRDTRRYAKRQLTWFNADPDIHWTSPQDLTELYPQIEAFVDGVQP
jgi:tRNA dimethylallyltransferase